MKKKLQILGEFVGHLLVGSCMFTALLMTGAGVSYLVHLVSAWLHDPYFEEAMRLLERGLLYADVAFLLWWTCYSTFKAIKEMIRDE